ncbi:GGDEF domain-containing protein [Paractinoplanes lichenicola]|uniref:GGDEF domain-containing protein n=1 Tax=Paractinoplanes lichenicola TaxID=2802976 RepID=A0ABS1VLI9_9ACTN|nr:GGDEF domain-containing protein [Actinoplanes lichenicola]MBL7255463.1 GGDEF domain-containing protein [Actinoplanes lichenicola]
MRLLSRFAPLIVIVVLAAVATAGVTWNPPFDRHLGPAVAYLVLSALFCVFVNVLAVLDRDPARTSSLELLQTAAGIVVTDLVLASMDQIGHIAVWPGAVFVLLTASTRRQRRGALVAWAAIVPALITGFALRGMVLDAVAPALLLLIFAVASSDQAWRLARTRTRLDAAEEQVRLLSGADPVTGLLTRATLQDRAGLTLNETAVIAVELDGFRELTDAFGHDAGDTLLRTVADRMRSTVADDALVARLAGQQFVIVLPNTSRAAAQACADRLARLADEPVVIDGARAPFGVSLGLAYGSLSGPVTLRDLLRIAEGRARAEAVPTWG